MHRAWLVAKREYLTNLRRPGFLFGTFGVPVILFVVMFVVTSVAIDAEENTERIGQVGYVDESGVLADAINRPDAFSPYAAEAEARAALENGEIGAYYVVEEDYLRTGSVRLISRSGVPDALNDQFDTFLLHNVGRELPEAVRTRISDPVSLEILTLDTGRTVTSEGAIGLIFAPIIFVFVFMFASQVASTYLMSGVVEEKSNRVMEILVTSLSPFELLFGKILGLGALGLTQLVIWLAGGLLVLALGRDVEALSGISFPLDLVVIGLIYFVLGYFLLASIMAGIGAVVGSEQESRQLAGIFSLALVLPFFFLIQFMTDPNGTLPAVLTLVPLTAPVAAILRMAFAPIPTWQLVTSIALLAVSTAVVTWAAARVFRWSLLMYGKRPSLLQVLRAVRSSSMGTTATGESKG